MSENASGEADSSSDAENKEFSCSACGNTYDSQRGLSIHESKVHGGPVDGSGVDCPGCDRSFSSRPGLITHLSGSGSCGSGHECGDCGRTFPTKRGWRHHRKEVHDVDTRPTVACETCGGERQVDPNHAEQSDKHFCSRECFGEWKTEHQSGEQSPQFKGRVTLECVMCGDEYEVIPSRSDSIVCSDECRGAYVSEHYSGENGSRWKGGSINYYGENWNQQRKKALTRDEYTCQYCGKDLSDGEKDPDVHHIKRLKWFVDNYDAPEWWERGNRLENLITACRTCHNRWEGIPITPERL